MINCYVTQFTKRFCTVKDLERGDILFCCKTLLINSCKKEIKYFDNSLSKIYEEIWFFFFLNVSVILNEFHLPVSKIRILELYYFWKTFGPARILKKQNETKYIGCSISSDQKIHFPGPSKHRSDKPSKIISHKP